MPLPIALHTHSSIAFPAQPSLRAISRERATNWSWLWYQTDMVSDTFALADNSEATVMLARSLTLECPRGQTGHETISSEGPTRLPESRRAIQSGKLPRKSVLWRS